MDSLAPESMKIIDLAVSLGERYNSAEGGLVRLRDLFGALLLSRSEPLDIFRRILEGTGVPPMV
jgi:hypothetical protein